VDFNEQEQSEIIAIELTQQVRRELPVIGIQKPLNPITGSGDIRTWLKTLL
jgi:hypothetical protein